MHRIAAALMLLVGFSGCLGAEDAADAVGPSDASLPDIPRVNLAPAVEQEPSLEEPPTWRSGQWWRIRLTELFFGPGGNSYETLRVVGGVEGDDYLVGMPVDEWSHDMLVLHIPGFGEVDRGDLSFETHDVRFEPLRFPLTEGNTWATAWEGRPVEALVTEASGLRAGVYLSGAQDHINLTYDAELGAIVELQIDRYARYEVLDHGLDYEGRITVPHGHDLVFVELRYAALMQAGNPQTSVTDEVDVATTYDRVSFVLLVGNFDPTLPQGVYRERVTAPDGTVYELSAGPGDTGGLNGVTYTHDQPGGSWTFEHTALGAGLALCEGIAYHVYDIELPSGRILPSTGEHDHGA